MRWLVRALVALALMLVGVALVGYFFASRQGVPSKDYQDAKIKFDEQGIPTIEAADWGALIEAQGFVVASQRFFQMDLIRRKAGGRLAEWFGGAAFDHDVMVQREDRLALTLAAADALPPEERAFCDRYAKGVNRFVEENPWRVGVEYQLLQVKPEPWTCADSLLVLFEMTDVLSSSADREAENEAWRRNLSRGWQDFLFPVDHAWNRPYFGTPQRRNPPFPPPAEYIPKAPLDPKKSARTRHDDPVPVGSNNWMWRGPSGAYVVNDPHLGNAVPSIWYATRLRINKAEWVVGVAIPGLPGVVIGMNPSVAWAFTNTGEDVDDYLLVDASEPLETKTFAIKVKGEDEPRRIHAQFSKYGPVAERMHLGAGLYARQWLPLKPGMLRLPTVQFMKTTDVADFDRAVDSMVIPSQNVLVMDHKGDMGYRMSGTGVKRQANGRIPQPAAKGFWLELQDPRGRLSQYYKGEGDQVRFLATANERVWIDSYGAQWASDDRKDRIVRFLSERQDFARVDMEKLQVDTQGRFRRLLVQWVANRASAKSGPAAELANQMHAWDGSSRSNPAVMTASVVAEEALMKVLLARVQDRFPHAEDRAVSYGWYLRRGWLLEVIEAPEDEGFAPFGLGASEVANYLLDEILAAKGGVPHQVKNRWQGQHPFVGRVPVLGELFKVEEIEQWGAHDMVDAEQPFFGPSTRLVWDMRRPLESTWAFPVGQSGHIANPHYKDLQTRWRDDRRLAVFADGSEWEFVGRR